VTAQIINVKFDRVMQVAFVNGIPWSYDTIEEMARIRKEDPSWYINSKVDDRGLLIRTVPGPAGPRTFDHDIGLVGEVEPLPGAPEVGI